MTSNEKHPAPGKKINWKDGVAALFHLIRFNFFVSNERAFVAGRGDPGEERPPWL